VVIVDGEECSSKGRISCKLVVRLGVVGNLRLASAKPASAADHLASEVGMISHVASTKPPAGIIFSRVRPRHMQHACMRARHPLSTVTQRATSLSRVYIMVSSMIKVTAFVAGKAREHRRMNSVVVDRTVNCTPCQAMYCHSTFIHACSRVSLPERPYITTRRSHKKTQPFIQRFSAQRKWYHTRSR
jgi:hypothetical protein